MSSPQDPFAPPSDGDQPGSGQPPAYGGQPPAYGGQPPAYGGQPPAYGEQPPAYGSQPPAYGQQPGGQPPAYGGQPPAYGPPPGAYGGAPLYTKNSLGVWSMVLAGVAFFCAGPLASIPGVILGHLAIKANREQTANNYGLAMAGTIINWVVTVGYVALLLWLFAFGGMEWYFNILDDSMTID